MKLTIRTPSSQALPVEVFDASFELVFEGTVAANAQLDVQAGPHLVRLWLPDGQTSSKSVVVKDGGCSVDFNPPLRKALAQSSARWFDSAPWPRYESVRSGTVSDSAADYSERYSFSGRGRALYLGTVHVMGWYQNRGVFKRLDHDSRLSRALGPDSSVEIQAEVRLEPSATGGQRFLQVLAAERPSALIGLPEGPATVVVHADPDLPVIEVHEQDHWAAMLARTRWLGDRRGANLAAKQLLSEAVGDPTRAALLALHILDEDAPSVRIAEFAERFPRSIDIALAQVWQNLRQGRANEAGDALLEACARGIPTLTESLGLLRDGLRLFQDQPAFVAAWDRARPAFAAADWSSPRTLLRTGKLKGRGLEGPWSGHGLDLLAQFRVRRNAETFRFTVR